MSPETYQHIEAIVMNISLVVLFGLMGMAVHDVLKKNKVPMIGRVVAYGVLGLGALGFLAKGIIQVFYLSAGVS
ncbi:DUF2788 domain-containing protein [Glaciecola sp. KUL10]|jgi:uncharacterized membrane protein|uniref:DUF2788 domain-containing protein n=1 Tax=Glaciecola sp. (strain KUL10) TaxID=2161813 RepID=UPI000D783FDE|nr:DUF2788 domain-containing protein [Glaciecola sp. KUL10]GBL02792.1 hypothetical protein KUL10_00650 [Glaciecola sp. KUL10]